MICRLSVPVKDICLYPLRRTSGRCCAVNRDGILAVYAVGPEAVVEFKQMHA